MKADSLILDVDGTIWNSTPVVAQAWNTAVQTAKLSIAEDVKKSIETRTITPELLQQVFGKTMDLIADELFPQLTRDQKNYLMERCCKKEHDAIKANTQDISYKGIRETIKTLSTRYKIFIVSNCQSGYIEICMEQNSLENYITDFECFGNTRLSKAKNIAGIIHKHHLKKTVYIGDTQGDYEASKENEIPFIFASYGFGNPCSWDAKIDTPSELLKLF